MDVLIWALIDVCCGTTERWYSQRINAEGTIINIDIFNYFLTSYEDDSSIS